MSDKDPSIDELKAEIAGLRRELREAKRARLQTERTAKRSEALSVQSKRAMLRTFGELEQRVEELRAAKVAAEQAALAKGRFLATMSHELRTPLNGMVGSSELLLSTELGAEQRELAELLQRSSLALLSIVNDVLDYSRIEAKRMPIERIAFDLGQCMRDVVDLQRRVATEKGLELRVRLAPDLPRVVIGDPGRLRQVLLNLLTNALKFTSHGFVEVSAAAYEGGEIVFAVKDTGIGIPEEAQVRLFDAFAQADASTTRRFGGTGLGLAVCKRLVALMGGSIDLVSIAGEGSTFRFSCVLPPAAAGELPAPGEGGAAVAATSPTTAGGSRGRVLVVDDNPGNRTIVARMLTRLGYDSDLAVDGVDAVTRASCTDYTMVLMDCSMPVMDGYDATRAIRSLPGSRSQVKIVALTANSMCDDEDRCRAVGMDDFLAKPVRLAELAAAIERMTTDAPAGTGA